MARLRLDRTGVFVRGFSENHEIFSPEPDPIFFFAFNVAISDREIKVTGKLLYIYLATKIERKR